MNSKRRARAVFLSALLVFACLTAIPTASEAYMVKWWQYPPMIGDPDMPTNDGVMIRVRLGSYTLSLLSRGSSPQSILLILTKTSSANLRPNRKR